MRAIFTAAARLIDMLPVVDGERPIPLLIGEEYELLLIVRGVWILTLAGTDTATALLPPVTRSPILGELPTTAVVLPNGSTRGGDSRCSDDSGMDWMGVVGITVTAPLACPDTGVEGEMIIDA